MLQELSHISDFLGERPEDHQSVVFVSPHDDDAILGAGMLIARLAKEKVRPKILVVTDGTMGYRNPEEQSSIVATRRKETMEAYEQLEIPKGDVRFLDFPDDDTTRFLGRRVTLPSDPKHLQGGSYVGLEDRFVVFFRAEKPSHVFTTSARDDHIDHQNISRAVRASLLHAHEGIWPELGPPSDLPRLAVWNTPSPYRRRWTPSMKFEGNSGLWERKRAAIKSFVSQREVVARLVREMREQLMTETFCLANEE